jgi:hypothetical protein
MKLSTQPPDAVVGTRDCSHVATIVATVHAGFELLPGEHVRFAKSATGRLLAVPVYDHGSTYHGIANPFGPPTRASSNATIVVHPDRVGDVSHVFDLIDGNGDTVDDLAVGDPALVDAALPIDIARLTVEAAEVDFGQDCYRDC